MDHMQKYGESGFSMNDPDKGNDPLRKAKYLICGDAFPEYFGLSAIDFEKMFQVEYHDLDNRFTLHEREMSLLSFTLSHTPSVKGGVICKSWHL